MTDASDIPVLSVCSDGQLFGLEVRRVVHVLKTCEIAPVPGTPTSIAGLINLRGRIIVALDFRAILGQPGRADGDAMGVILDTPAEQICLMVDTVGEVLDLSPRDRFETPRHMPQRYISLAENCYRLKSDILIKLDESALLMPESLAA